MGLGKPDTPWVTIIFKGGAIHTEQNPDILIYLSRHDRMKIMHVMLDGSFIDGRDIEDIKGHLISTKVRYV